MKDLKVGQKLVIKKAFLEGVNIGDKGTICEIREDIVIIKMAYGKGGFSESELDIYFEKYNPLAKYDDVEKYIVNENVVVVILKSGCKGIAKCLKEDVFNEETGIRIAYLKAKIKEMNKELKQFYK